MMLSKNDTHHYDTQNNGIRHNYNQLCEMLLSGLNCDTQHNTFNRCSESYYAECIYADCHWAECRGAAVTRIW
jgi:hypothetical protein